jgi:2-polyprenyl-3-methyl-5-hydroxy-6-metoxy-1,4-benzoquinol methylase
MECRVCNGKDLEFFYDQGRTKQFRFYRCRNCGLVNLDMDHTAIVGNQKKYSDQPLKQTDYEKNTGGLKAFLFAKKYIPGKGKFLDIGCGAGSVLYFFKKDGWDVSGLELSEVLAEHVRSRLNIQVEVTDFLKLTDHKTRYDLISLRHVLEHLPDPLLAMKKISELLVENGFGHIEFPNINSLSHRFQRVRNKWDLLRKKYDPDFAPGHCNEFSKASFKFLIEKAGFDLIRWETYSNKPVPDFFNNHLHFGTKARAIIRKRKKVGHPLLS